MVRRQVTGLVGLKGKEELGIVSCLFKAKNTYG